MSNIARQLMPLRFKLPLLLSTILIVVVAAMCLFGYRQIEQVLLDSTETRLKSVTQTLDATLVESARRMNTDMRQFARDSNIVRFLLQPTTANRAVVTRTLAKARTGPTLAIALSAKDGTQSVLAGPNVRVNNGDSLTGIAVGAARSAKSDTLVIGQLQRSDSGVIYRVRVPVISPSGDTIGHVTTIRSIGSGQGAGLLNDLIGANSTLLFGNANGGLWTDLRSVVKGPPMPVKPGVLTEYTDGKGVSVLGAGTPIRSTPWIAWVQLPRSSALGPARRFLAGMGGIAFVVVMIGAMTALLVSRQTTTPLDDVSRAAQDLASGHYDRRVRVVRRDEIGLLAESFNGMAQQIQNSNEALLQNAAALENANADLRDSELRYRGLVERLPDAVLVHRDGRVVFTNPAALSLFAASNAGEILGRNVEDIVPQESAVHSTVTDEMLSGAASGRLRSQQIKRFNNTNVSVDATTIPYTHDGHAASLTILRDVSERERLEERFRQSQKMEAVGQLAGGVAHDFNNILTVVTSYSAMLLAELPAESAMREDIQEIANAADRAASLTRQLLAFSRQQVLEPRIVDLNQVVGDMQKMLRRVIPADIEITTKFDPVLGRINADPGQLEQVLMNLCVNARDAMPDGGVLHIETSGITIDETGKAMHSGATAGEYVLLSVSDSGHGMTKEQQARIFDPFYTTKAQGKGTGLGLATVYGIVQQSSGYIWVYSEVGHGTVFRIYLPRVQNAQDSRPAIDVPNTDARGHETILLVEDEISVRTAARRILESAGYHVMDVPGPREAMLRSAQHIGPIHLLLTDMVMPEMSGRELSGKFRVERPGALTVFMSGYTEDAVLRQSVGEPGTFFIQKPFTPQSLRHKIRMVLDQPAL